MDLKPVCAPRHDRGLFPRTAFSPTSPVWILLVGGPKVNTGAKCDIVPIKSAVSELPLEYSNILYRELVMAESLVLRMCSGKQKKISRVGVQLNADVGLFQPSGPVWNSILAGEDLSLPLEEYPVTPEISVRFTQSSGFSLGQGRVKNKTYLFILSRAKVDTSRFVGTFEDTALNVGTIDWSNSQEETWMTTSM